MYAGTWLLVRTRRQEYKSLRLPSWSLLARSACVTLALLTMRGSGSSHASSHASSSIIFFSAFVSFSLFVPVSLLHVSSLSSSLSSFPYFFLSHLFSFLLLFQLP